MVLHLEESCTDPSLGLGRCASSGRLPLPPRPTRAPRDSGPIRRIRGVPHRVLRCGWNEPWETCIRTPARNRCASLCRRNERTKVDCRATCILPAWAVDGACDSNPPAFRVAAGPRSAPVRPW
eukprot:scaffold31_cov334-Pavlova_lutheri.AAC.72